MAGIQLKAMTKLESGAENKLYYMPPPDPLRGSMEATANPAVLRQSQETPSHVNPAFTDDAQITSGFKGSAEISATEMYEGIKVKDTESQSQGNCCTQHVQLVQDRFGEIRIKHQSCIKRVIIAVLAMLYAAYFAYALHYRFGDEGSIRLLWVTCVACALLLISVIKKYYGTRINEKVIQPAVSAVSSKWHILRWIVFPLLIIALVLFIILDIAVRRPTNLVSLSGIAVFVIVFFVFSHSKTSVRWRPVIWGLALQFILGLIVLRTSWGRAAFDWLGARVKEFLEHTNAGSSFVFGPKYTDHPFAMKVMPVVIFFSTVISILYYIGVMQVVISKLAWIMQVTMGTTAGESLNAAGNIFVGQTEAPLLIRPIIHDMTNSELHAVLVGGFATIAGAVMATFISMGVPANHLLTASVMSAPAALAMSKLSYPETKTSKTTVSEVAKMEKMPYRNAVEAASVGASSAIKLVANIIVNLIAFIGLLTFVNATLQWFGARVGLEPPRYPPLTFQLICSYVLSPISLIMGVTLQDCLKVGELLGRKIFLNEFIAYTELSRVIKNREVYDNYTRVFNSSGEHLNNGDVYLPRINTTLVGGVMQDRSIAISTYALCGFANISSMGIALGGVGAMAPERKGDLASFAVRAMITGATASFMTAAVAGLMYQGK